LACRNWIATGLAVFFGALLVGGGIVAVAVHEKIQSWRIDALLDDYQIRKNFPDPHAQHFFTLIVKSEIGAVLDEAKTIPGGVNATGTDGITPLLVATWNQDPAMVKALLKAGANPDGAGRWVPLGATAVYGNLTIARILLAHGANPDGRPGTLPPLAEAAEHNHRATVDFLLAAGAHIDAADEDGETAAISAAASNGGTGMVNYLLDRGASIWDATRAGHTIGNLAGTSCVEDKITNPQTIADCQELLARLHAAHYPWPPPTAQEMRKILDNNQWPPAGIAR
jgi:ankyrin repeat protein